ncbi:DUF6053 domain-containing protein [Lysobacter enzymogenes]|uniref:DUF6053 domain-containing protein n=1 Tax=Lysobacter enzymogenes TaxID=69 RepID=UPI003D18ED01
MRRPETKRPVGRFAAIWNKSIGTEVPPTKAVPPQNCDGQKRKGRRSLAGPGSLRVARAYSAVRRCAARFFAHRFRHSTIAEKPIAA